VTLQEVLEGIPVQKQAVRASRTVFGQNFIDRHSTEPSPE
jgi:hypothetical protein